MGSWWAEFKRNRCIVHHKAKFWAKREEGGQKCSKCQRVWHGKFGALGAGGKRVM